MTATREARRNTPGTVAERWAWFVFTTFQAESDPKTLDMWARVVGVSRSALCECCRLIHVSPHDARDFTRMARALCHSGAKWQPEALMDFADVRTLNRLLSRAGLKDVDAAPSLLEFLERQQWIPQDNPGLRALRVLFLRE